MHVRLQTFAGAALAMLTLAAAACRPEPQPPTGVVAPAAVEHAAATLPEGIVPPRYSKAVRESGTNLAYDQPVPSIDPRLTEHSRRMAQRIYQTAGNVYCAVGYGLANMTMIEGTDGVIIVDTLEAVENARQVMAAFRTITTNPVKAVVYTHNHYDHVMGTEGVVTRAEVDSGQVPIYGHARLMQGFLNQLSVVGEAVGIRSFYTLRALQSPARCGAAGPTPVGESAREDRHARRRRAHARRPHDSGVASYRCRPELCAGDSPRSR